MKEQEAITCTHCSEPCNEEILRNDAEQPFCCTGCRTVYEILNDNALTDFYCIAEDAGTSQKNQGNLRYDFLDDEEIRQKLIQFEDGTQARVSFYLPSIHCTSCLWLLEKLPQIQPGILQSRVNYLRKEVAITFEPEHLSLRQLAELLRKLGYPPNITLESFENQEKQRPGHTRSKQYLYKLGVTGFCFGNIMLLSFPEYLGLSEPETTYREYFGYLNLLLSLPVFFYGASDYLRSAWAALRHGGVNIDVPISLGILSLFLRSAYEIVSQTGAGYLDSLASLIFLLLIGKWFQERTFEHISFERDYKSYFPVAVTRLEEDGTERSVPLNKLKLGDQIFVHNEEVIPADGILIHGEARLDYSFVTGEAKPVRQDIGSQLYAGGRQQGGRIQLKLTKEVSQSYLTDLWNAEAFTKKDTKSWDSLTDKIGKYFTFVILFIGLATLAYWFSISPEQAVMNFTAVLIIACPCALALNVPFTLGNALGLLAKKNFYLKNTQAIEQLAKINYIVFDKTGTLTQGDAAQCTFHGETLNPEERQALRALVGQSHHPLSRQIAAWLGEGDKAQSSAFREDTGQGITVKIADSVWKLGKKSYVLGEKAENKEEAKLVLKTTSFLSIDGELRGHFEFVQRFRPGLQGLIETLKTQYRMAMLSGDHEGERERMAELFGEGVPLHFQQSPQNKMDFIGKVQSQETQVLMLGDGLNDAGALQQARVGLAVADDVHQFSPACDGILQADSVERLASYLAYSKNLMKVLRVGFIFSLLYNVVGLSFAVQGLLAPVIAAILMPLSSVTVVGFGVLAGTWYARKV